MFGRKPGEYERSGERLSEKILGQGFYGESRLDDCKRCLKTKASGGGVLICLLILPLLSGRLAVVRELLQSFDKNSLEPAESGGTRQGWIFQRNLRK